MTKYSGQGWHFQHTRHSNARKYGRAGGSYAKSRVEVVQADVPDRWFVFKDEECQDAFNTEAKAKKYAREIRKAEKKHFGGYTPNYIRGGLADGVNPNRLNQEELQKGVSVELEHTNNPVIAREIATDHLVENPKYYDKLEKIEAKPKPINVKIPKHQVMRDKNQLEKDLQSQINKTTDVDEKKRLEKMYRELRQADSHNKFKRFIDEYGYALSTIGLALPFYLTTPLIIAGVVLGASVTGELPSDITTLAKLGTPSVGFVISTEAVKHSIRTIKAIKKREREIIIEKTKELRENTSLPEKEIKTISKRIAQQELSKTTLTHELV